MWVIVACRTRTKETVAWDGKRWADAGEPIATYASEDDADAESVRCSTDGVHGIEASEVE